MCIYIYIYLKKLDFTQLSFNVNYYSQVQISFWASAWPSTYVFFLQSVTETLKILCNTSVFHFIANKITLTEIYSTDLLSDTRSNVPSLSPQQHHWLWHSHLYYSWLWRPLHLPALLWSLFICASLCPLAEEMLSLILFSLLPSLPSLGNFTTDYIQLSNVPCADNSLVSFPPVKLTSLSSNQSSVHSSARSLLMSSYQFTLHASQHHSHFPLHKSFHLFHCTPYPHTLF